MLYEVITDMENLIDPIIIVEDGRIIFNYSLEEISSSITFRLADSKPEGEDVIYYEKVLGGYLTAYRSADDDGRALDLEFLFNMAVSRGDELNNIISGGAK